MTLYYVPVMPVKNRYPEEWYHQFQDEFKKAKIDYMTIDGLSENETDIPIKVKREGYDMFTSLDLATKWELNQLQWLLNISDQIKDGDIIFFTDVDFPGFCLPFAQLIKLKVPGIKLFGYLHAGSYCNGDIFSRTPGKLDTERATFKIFDGIFVGSEYHKLKITTRFGTTPNIHVVGAPFYVDEVRAKISKIGTKKKYDIIYPTRIDKQDNGATFLNIVENNPALSFVCTFKPPKEKNNLEYIPTYSRYEYFTLLNQSKVYLNTSKESTFGYAALEALAFGAIPVVPDKYSFPEILDKYALYYQSLCTEEICSLIRKGIHNNSKPENGFFKQWEDSIPAMIRRMTLGVDCYEFSEI